MGVQWCLTVLLCIQDQSASTSPFAPRVSPLGRSPFRSLVYILTEQPVLSVLGLKSSLYNLDNGPSSDTRLAKIFFPVCSHLYVPAAMSFTEQKLLVLVKSDIRCFMMPCALGAVVESALPNPTSPAFLLLSSRSFINLHFRSTIHFESFSLRKVKDLPGDSLRLSLFVFACGYSVIPASFTEKTILSPRKDAFAPPSSIR